MSESSHTQLLIIGGGINGAGIAADAAGRGLSVRLVEKSDLASATSSSSSKLIHGGLRYLEHYEFRLVREALAEREVLLRKAPHLIKPLRFILPHRKHLRPAWMIWCGMFLYDHLSKLNQLPKSTRVKFNAQIDPLKSDITTGFEYSDCWVDDARLVVLNAIEASNRGAHIQTHTECRHVKYDSDAGLWRATLINLLTSTEQLVTADILVNATGPWAQKFIENQMERRSSKRVRLIKGSHLIMPQAYASDKAYILQNEDRRIVFVIPYMDKFTIIGTTDKEYVGEPNNVEIDNEEIDYLLNVYNRHFKAHFSKADIISHYSGVRPLCDDESSDPSAITRDYTLEIERADTAEGKGALLNIFGGKLTTYRKLAEAALAKIESFAPSMGAAWTAYAPLPGGEVTPDELEPELTQAYPWLPANIRRRWIISYGTLARQLLEGCRSLEDLGQRFGADLTEKEVIYLMEQEWVRSVDDLLLRRTKLGLTCSDGDREALSNYIDHYLAQHTTLQDNAGPTTPTHSPEQKAQ